MKKTSRSIPYKWKAISVVGLGGFMATMDAGAVRITLPHLGNFFQVGPDTIAWVWLAFLLVSSGLLLPLGWFGDVVGRKRLYTIGLVIFSVALTLSSLSQSLVQLIMFRMLQAVGTAMTIATGNAIITSAFPSEERGRAIGMVGTVLGLGMLSGPALGGLLLDSFGWRSVFFVRAPLGFLMVIMAWTLLKEQNPPNRKGKFDFLGAVTLFLTLTFILVALNRGQSLGWTSPLVIGSGIAGIISFSVFILTEGRAAQPVLDLRLFRDRLFRTASGSHFLLYVATTAVSFLMPFYLIQGLGFSASKAGLLLVTMPATSMLLAPISGRLSDRWGTLFLCTSGVTLISIGTLLLSSLGDDVSAGIVVLYLAVIGLGMGFFTSPNTSAIMGSVPPERLGTASAMVGALRQVGMSVGVAIAASIFSGSQLSHAALLTSQGLPEDIVNRFSIVNGFHDAILVALGIAVIGIVATALRGRR